MKRIILILLLVVLCFPLAAQRGKLTLHLDDTEISARLEKWQQPAPKYTRGVLAKYAKLVSSASEGAVTDN